MSGVENEVSIAAYVADDASQADIDKVEDYVRGLEGVASVTFTDKEQALENFRSSNTTDIIDALDGQNPLPASIDVELSDPQLVEQVASAIWDNPTYQQIRDGETKSESLKYGQQTVEKLFTLTNYVRYIGIALIALLIFIAMVFINNTIRLAILARRKEIAIMRARGRVERVHPRALPHGGRAACAHRLASGSGRAGALAQHGAAEAAGRAAVPVVRRES